MHSHTLAHWRHDHVFLGAAHHRNERRTWLVVGLTAAMMVAEIVGGTIFGSMALLADGWHMSTHAGALGIAAFAYRYARNHAHDPRFAFGTGKLGDLAGFTSAIVLALISLLIGYESIGRLFQPVAIHYGEATAIAAVGLAVNLASAWLLGADHDHGHADTHRHPHDREDREHHAPHHDHNLRAAYWHVLADALTSVLAIAGLLAARFYGWNWLDPAIGVVGACVIAHWAWRLMRDAGAVLLDAVPNRQLDEAIRERLEVGDDRIADLHVWRLGPGHHGAIVSLVAHAPEPVAHYKARLDDLPHLSHITVEVHRCAGVH
ncbi:CDF family Co(II)/Ni(II) efflux transporter DmeF [Reyranella sp.]|jgi:cation diffusion facilitator family transporter|uniref:CDF family Co(II)/Ni(II) efflux transporter DmeF n=1 Tax=Reyranella sp. TaxID=1929291 RepID=UPI002F91D6CD